MTEPVDDARGELLALADDYEVGLKRMEASGYEEFDKPRRNHRVIIAALRAQAAAPAHASPPSEAGRAPVVSVKSMGLSDGRTDYFVSIKVGDREVTPHVFSEEYKAAYHVALYDWLLNGSGEEPDVVEFGPNDWPARALSHPDHGTSTKGD